MGKRKTEETARKKPMRLSKIYRQAFTEWLRSMNYSPKYAIVVNAPGTDVDQAMLDSAAGMVMQSDPINGNCDVAISGSIQFVIKGTRGAELGQKIQPIVAFIDRSGVSCWSPSAAAYIFAAQLKIQDEPMDELGQVWARFRVIGEHPRQSVQCKIIDSDERNGHNAE